MTEYQLTQNKRSDRTAQRNTFTITVRNNFKSDQTDKRSYTRLEIHYQAARSN